MKLAEPENILEFWFGANDGDGEVIKAKSWLWWSKDEVIDRSIANRFGDDLDRAIGGAIDHWALTPRGQLALNHSNGSVLAQYLPRDTQGLRPGQAGVHIMPHRFRERPRSSAAPGRASLLLSALRAFGIAAITREIR